MLGTFQNAITPPLKEPTSGSKKALRKAEKASARLCEASIRAATRQQMHSKAQFAALDSFASLMSSTTLLPAGLPVAVRLHMPLWDATALATDAIALLALFPPARQYGDLHSGTWRTLCLRSSGGALDDDSPGPHYDVTPAWAASTYIVPVVLRSLLSQSDPRGDLLLQRVRLSVIPPGCNVAWHTDYEGTATAGPMRLHIPLLCSPAFDLDIAGRCGACRSG
jgi:hypothetical protein